jgi:hypothetical protein
MLPIFIGFSYTFYQVDLTINPISAVLAAHNCVIITLQSLFSSIILRMPRKYPFKRFTRFFALSHTPCQYFFRVVSFVVFSYTSWKYAVMLWCNLEQVDWPAQDTRLKSQEVPF